MRTRAMTGNRFQPEALLKPLVPWLEGPVCWVAYSGGLDSHVLLHALARLRASLPVPLRAIHVHHGLQTDADAWLDHCRRVCAELSVPLANERVQVPQGGGASLEEAARHERYRVFRRVLSDGGVLVTAHHLNDQVETVFQRLFRGSGPRGLAGIAPQRPLGKGMVVRPLLDVPREALEAYAAEQGLNWIEDPSNADRRHDRNFLRHEILPRVRERWPGMDAAVARSAGHCREAEESLEAVAHEDLAEVAEDGLLRVGRLLRLSRERRVHLVRLWLREAGLRPPNRARLCAGMEALLTARPDRSPTLEWPEGRVRRYRGRLYAMDPVHTGERVTPAPVRWDLKGRLRLPGSGEVWCESGPGGLDPALAETGVDVRFREGGEICLPAGADHRRSVKRLLQEAGVPPWLRPVIPLLYVNGRLAAIPGVCVCRDFQAKGTGLVPRWRSR